jgi:hypothetical protein
MVDQEQSDSLLHIGRSVDYTVQSALTSSKNARYLDVSDDSR